MAQTGRSSAGSRQLYKDTILDETARAGNVAQFVSFNPELRFRYSRVRGFEDNHRFASVYEAAASLLAASTESAVNIRSFDPYFPESRKFIYGLTDPTSVASEVERLASEGLHTIINETVDVEDGGVSGVVLGDVVEFAPKDTPRAVEKPGVASFSRELAFTLLKTVYGFAPELNYPTSYRVEFSVHPLRRGVRNQHTIVWQFEEVGETTHGPSMVWPNRFSRFVGDKVFGLLMADLIGLPVPATLVIPRELEPFRFGRQTGTAEVWIRTAPTEKQPGKFTTQRGWMDPFALLAREDPDGTAIASVLAQEGVDAQYSGALVPAEDGEPIIEGVRGWGDEFMVGKMAPETLPHPVITAVKTLFEKATARLGPVRMEWVFDGQEAWVVQLHRGALEGSGETIVPGEPVRFHPFNVSEGIEVFRNFAEDIQTKREGIILVGNVGVTSHFGDILRRLGIPSKIESVDIGSGR
jgi:hypothetical protein